MFQSGRQDEVHGCQRRLIIVMEDVAHEIQLTAPVRSLTPVQVTTGAKCIAETLKFSARIWDVGGSHTVDPVFAYSSAVENICLCHATVG